MTRASVTAKDIVPYKENKDKYGNVKKKKFAIALKEIEETPLITENPSRVTSKTVEIENNNADSNSNSIDASNIDTPLVIAESGVNGNNSVNGESSKKKGAGRARKRKITAPTEVTEAKKGKKRGRKAAANKNSSTKPVETETNLTDITNEENKNETFNITNETTVNASGDSDLVNASKLAKLREKAAEKEKLKEKLKLAKLEKKRQERLEKLKSLPVTDSLLKDIEHEIMESLSVEKTDIPRCLQALTRLDLFQVTPQALCSYPKILNTIKLCRKYKSDEKVRQKSNYLYNKFKLLFANGIDEVSLITCIFSNFSLTVFISKSDVIISFSRMSQALQPSTNSRNHSPEPSPVPDNQTTLPDSTSDANESEQPVSHSLPEQAVSSSLTTSAS